jgi:hypothetical protein
MDKVIIKLDTMTQDELNVLIDEKQEKTPALDEPKTVPIEEYQKVVKMHENIQSLSDRKDKELHELREKVKNIENEDNFEEDDEVLKSKLIKMGFVASDKVDEQVERQLSFREKVEKLRNDLTETVTKMPFVDGSKVLDFIKVKGNLTVSEAVQLLYPKELESFNKSEDITPHIIDAGGRTLNNTSIQVDNPDTVTRRGIPKGSNLVDFISNRIESAVKRENTKL